VIRALGRLRGGGVHPVPDTTPPFQVDTQPATSCDQFELSVDLSRDLLLDLEPLSSGPGELLDRVPDRTPTFRLEIRETAPRGFAHRQFSRWSHYDYVDDEAVQNGSSRLLALPNEALAADRYSVFVVWISIRGRQPISGAIRRRSDDRRDPRTTPPSKLRGRPYGGVRTPSPSFPIVRHGLEGRI